MHEHAAVAGLARPAILDDEAVVAVGGVGDEVAFGVGYAVIVWFLAFVSHNSYKPFVLYRLMLAEARLERARGVTPGRRGGE